MEDIVNSSSYVGKLKTSLTWWLGSKGFVINDEYKLELLFLDFKNKSAKIRITNLKTGTISDSNVEPTGVSDGLS